MHHPERAMVEQRERRQGSAQISLKSGQLGISEPSGGADAMAVANKLLQFRFSLGNAAPSKATHSPTQRPPFSSAIC